MLAPNCEELDELLDRVEKDFEKLPDGDAKGRAGRLIDDCKTDYAIYMVGCQVAAILSSLILNNVITDEQYSDSLKHVKEMSYCNIIPTICNLKELAEVMEKAGETNE